MQAFPEANLSTPYQTAVMTVLALCAYAADKNRGIEMLNWLRGPRPLNGQEISFLNDRFRGGKTYLPYTYFAGATPDNGYTPAQPYTITVECGHFSEEEAGYMKLFIPCALILNLLSAGSMTLMLPFTLEKGFTVDMYGYLMSVETAASLLCVCLLGVVRLKPKARYWGMSGGFLSATLFFILTYLAKNFAVMCVSMFLASFANAMGNCVFNASMMLALPEENRGAILGFISAASTGGCALSSVIFGVLGDVFPLYLVFTAGCLLSVLPMAYMCLHKHAREFVLMN